MSRRAFLPLPDTVEDYASEKRQQQTQPSNHRSCRRRHYLEPHAGVGAPDLRSDCVNPIGVEAL